LHPPEDRDVVSLDTTLDEKFFDVAVGQVVPQIRPDRDHDHVRRKPEPGERRPCQQCCTPAAGDLHDSSVPDQANAQRNGAV
jgi:hypothetical protein